MNAIDIKDLSCQFGMIRALDGVSFGVQAGTVLGVVGPNGAGKTTIIDAICGLIRPDSGTVEVLGQLAASAGAKLRAKIGVLTQETSLYEEVSALQNLRFAAALYGVENAEQRINEVLKLVGLRDRAAGTVRTFSGGMQRRLAIARALLHDPELLILDEPTIGVDVEARHQIWAHIRSLKAKGRTVVLTTNYLDEAEALCDHMVVLRQGKLIAQGTPAVLMERTGRCLELTVEPQSGSKLKTALSRQQGILRVEDVDFGLRLYLAAGLNPEDVVKEARRLCTIEGFRTRSPDLAEIFRAHE